MTEVLPVHLEGSQCSPVRSVLGKSGTEAQWESRTAGSSRCELPSSLGTFSPKLLALGQ